MSNINTTIAIQRSTRNRLKRICSEEGRTYDGMLRYWIKSYEEKEKKNRG